MLVLRCTTALLKKLRASPAGESARSDTTTLGEWYANRILLERRGHVLFLNAATRAVVLVEAAPTRTLFDRFREQLAAFLVAVGVSEESIQREIDTAREITIARTTDRSVVGSMVQLAKDIAIVRRVRASRPGPPSDSLEIHLAFLVNLPLPESYPVDAVRARFGLLRTWEVDLVEPPPGSILVRRTHERDWEFSFPRVGLETMEKVWDAMERFDAGSSHTAWFAFERVVREHPECITAINGLAVILDEHPGSHKSLPVWRHAAAIAQRALPADFRIGRDRLPWGLQDNRPYLRACAGLALALERSGEIDEAESRFGEMLALNPDDNQGIRQRLVDLRLKKGDDTGALAVCDTYPEDTTESVLFGRVLALFRTGRGEEAREALDAAAGTLPLVAQEIARAYHLPPTGLHPDHVTVGGADQAFRYWERTGEAWTRTPGAIEFVASFLAERRGAAGPPGNRRNNVIPLRPGFAVDPPAGEFLSDELVDAVAAETVRFFHANFPNGLHYLLRHDPADGIRYQQLGERIRRTREAAGLTTKEVAAKLKVPQYRLDATEGKGSRSFEPAIFWKYCEFLGLRDFVLRWIAANGQTARKMGIEPPPKAAK